MLASSHSLPVLQTGRAVVEHLVRVLQQLLAPGGDLGGEHLCAWSKRLRDCAGKLRSRRSKSARCAQYWTRIALREVQLSAIRIFATEQHPDLERLRHEIASMKRELGKLEGGDGKTEPTATTSARFENLRRFRDMKFLERLTELLTQQFEAAKIDEAKNATLVQILDKAVEPERRSWPIRGQIVLIAAIVGLMLGIVAAFVREYLNNPRADFSRMQRMEQLRAYLRFREL